jgi:hypothetical protein
MEASSLRFVHVLKSRKAICALALVLAGYFGVLVAPEWWPAIGQTSAYAIYLLSIPFALLALAALGVLGVAGTLIGWWRGSSIGVCARLLLAAPAGGFALFALSVGVAAFVRGPLPTGSHVLAFDSSAWQRPESAEYVRNDITVRQKMLGGVVDEVLPGHTKEEIEAALGPSLDTPYFQSTGRDMIYILGPQRDPLFGIDSEWLLIWLDASGRFARYSINTD